MPETFPDTARPGRDDGRIPVSLVTGFLGAGKTTLVDRLLRHAEMAGTVLLVNEFGEVGVDGHLVEALDEHTVLLESGCLCCTMNGDLIAALTGLHARMAKREIAPIRRVIIETTGLADPVPVVSTLMENRALAVRFVCDGVVTVIDATRGLDPLERHGEAWRQASIADLLLLGKCDLAPRTARVALTEALRRVNPTARVVEMRHGDVAPEVFFGAGLYAADRRTRSIDEWLGWSAPSGPAAAPAAPAHGRALRRPGCDHAADGPACACADAGDRFDASPLPDDAATVADRHGPGISTFVVGFDRPVAWRGLAVAMGEILARFGDRLLRVKGLMRVLGEEAPVVVQCVGDVAHAPVKLARWPAEGAFADRRGRLVFIADGLAAEAEAEIRARLAVLPGDGAAVRILARHPDLATRCWLSARLPTLTRGSFETDGFVVMPRGFTATARSA